MTDISAILVQSDVTALLIFMLKVVTLSVILLNVVALSIAICWSSFEAKLQFSCCVFEICGGLRQLY
jgi:hypothetical protein